MDIPLLNKSGGMARALVESIMSLTCKCHNYLKWYYLERMSIAEMGAMANNKENTIEKNLSHCRKKLRHYLKIRYGIS
jgi:predicted DNA-binding protein YlxM (UPF0122 family)